MSMDSSSPLSNTLLTTGIEACSSLVSMVSSLGSSLVGWFGLVWSIRHIVRTVLLLENGLRPATISRTIWHSTNSVPTWDHQYLNPSQKLDLLNEFVCFKQAYSFHLLFNAFGISSSDSENAEVWILRNFDFHYIFQLLKTVKFYWLKVFFIIFFQFCAVEKRSKWILCNIRYSNFSISKFTGWHAFWGETMDSRFVFSD